MHLPGGVRKKQISEAAGMRLGCSCQARLVPETDTKGLVSIRKNLEFILQAVASHKKAFKEKNGHAQICVLER